MFARLWAFYSKNTFARHIVIAIAAFTVMRFADPVTDLVSRLVGSDPASQGAILALSAWLIRWAQTNLELLTAKK